MNSKAAKGAKNREEKFFGAGGRRLRAVPQVDDRSVWNGDGNVARHTPKKSRGLRALRALAAKGSCPQPGRVV
jgi:hypothetical protein